MSLRAIIIILMLALPIGCSEPRGVVLWHAYSGDERTALEATAAAWSSAHPDQPLTLVAVPHDAFADKLSSAIPRGNGPDLFIYAQDRIGDWADAGVIEPIEFWVDDARAGRFTDFAVGAMAYRDSLWGLPLAVKSLALFYRTDLVATPPRTTDDILALAPAMHAKLGFELAYENIDLYSHAAWLHGFGGKILDDNGHFAIATPEAAAAMTFARSLITSGAVPEDAQSSLIASLFNQGKAATVMQGPWFMSDIGAGVPWKVTTLPIVSATGKPATPFASAEGILMSSRATNKDAAFAVMDFLTSDASAITRARLAPQVVPNPHAYDDPEVGKDATLAAFRAQLDHAVPMTNDARMRVVWTPYRTALGEVLAGRDEPAAKLEQLAKEIQSYADRK